MAADALTVFLPVAESFISNVMTTLVNLSPEMPATALGLTEMAGGLALIAIAGVALTTGAIGLLAAAGGLGLLIPACLNAKDVDLIPLAKGLAALVIPGAAMALVGPALTVLAAGMAVATPAIMAFTVAVAGLSAVLKPSLNKSMEEFGNKAKDAKKWGSDLVQNFIAGLKSKLNSLKNSVVEMAQLIKSYIGFTTPDMGPLSDFDTYGADMIMNFSDSMMGEMPYLEGDLKDATSTISSAFSGDNSLIANAGASMVDSFSAPILSGLDRLEKITGMKLDTVRGMFGTIQGYAYSAVGAKGNDSNKSTINDMDLARKEQIESRKKLAEATKEATAAEEGFAKASGGSSKAAKEEKEEIKDLSKAFESVAKATKKTLSQMSNNLAANLKETYSWAEDMKTFMAQTWDDTTKKWVESLGVAGHDTLRAFINATEEEAAVFKGLMPQYLTLDEDSKAMIAGDYSGLGLQIMQQYGEGIGLYSEELAENIQNAIKPFEAFNKELDVTKYQLMENLESQVKGVNEWADKLVELSNRAINENLLEYLRDMGPEGYKYVMAFGSMTDEELARTNELWDQTMNLGVTNAKKLYPLQYNKLGKAITEGFDTGIDKNKMVETIGTALDATVTKARAIYDWHSPSGLMLSMGQDIGRGFVDGINQIWKLSVIPTVTRVCEEVVNTFKMQLNDSTGRQLGADITQGIINGIRDREGDLYQTAWDIAYNAWQRAKEAVQSSSPSKRFIQLGRDMDGGLIIGINDRAEAVYSATENVGSETVNRMSQVIAEIARGVGGEFEDITPVIRPRLDLSDLQNGKSTINRMFNGTSYSLANDIIANGVTTPSVPVSSDSQIVNNQNFIFNQTNNSPKALDAYEIYRNSRNLLGQIKGAKA